MAPINLLAVFCYFTVTCDTQLPATGSQRVSTVVPVNQNVTRNETDGRKSVRQTSPYPTRYDYIDVEAVMSNDRILKVLFNCVMNRGPCTREGLELKRIIPDAFLTECAKCSDRQKKQAGKVLAHLLHYKPDYWKMLVEKFDPNNVYLKKYMTDNDDEDKIPLPTSPQKTSNNSTTNTTSST